MSELNKLKDCFREEFTEWLSKSNNKRIPKSDNNCSEIPLNLGEIVDDSLQEILEVLLREPLADYFWYGYPEHGGKLSYSLPHHDVVPGDALRVDKEKIKMFLRDIKINKILQ